MIPRTVKWIKRWTTTEQGTKTNLAAAEIFLRGIVLRFKQLERNMSRQEEWFWPNAHICLYRFENKQPGNRIENTYSACDSRMFINQCSKAPFFQEDNGRSEWKNLSIRSGNREKMLVETITGIRNDKNTYRKSVAGRWRTITQKTCWPYSTESISKTQTQTTFNLQHWKRRADDTADQIENHKQIATQNKAEL